MRDVDRNRGERVGTESLESHRVFVLDSEDRENHVCLVLNNFTHSVDSVFVFAKKQPKNRIR